ncbi:hypothetical protein EW146_g8167, partial [Bondarzewia mesenterica]
RLSKPFLFDSLCQSLADQSFAHLVLLSSRARIDTSLYSPFALFRLITQESRSEELLKDIRSSICARTSLFRDFTTVIFDMSRADMQDLDSYSAGTGINVVRINRSQDSVHYRSNSGSIAGYGSNDRGLPSSATGFGHFGNFSPPYSTLPRSMGIQERAFISGSGDSWGSTPNTNRHTPSVSHLNQLNHHPHHHLSTSPSLHTASGSPAAQNIDKGAFSVTGRSIPPLNPDYSLLDTSIDHGVSSTPEILSYYPPPPFLDTYSPTYSSSSSRSTLWWGDLEPWMDEEYAKQVCGLMGWDPVSVKVPHPVPDPVTGQQPNNPGYCFLTFPTPAHAASVLANINGNNKLDRATMPNSCKPFVLNWASSTPIPPSLSPSGVSAQQQQFPKEYSIFVGDLAPEASNSDLVAVFRNPVLGLRNDREPKFIRPFLSCKSAKIMLDPVTGVSRGYGFVRFTDEADQQLRISPATAKYKPPPSLDLPQVQIPGMPGNGVDDKFQAMTLALPLSGNSSQPKSVSSPIAGTKQSNGSTNSITSSCVSSSGSGSSLSAPSLSSGPTSSGSGSTLASAVEDVPQHYMDGVFKMSTNPLSSITTPFANQTRDQSIPPRYSMSEESWKHQAQARAILGNLIGPNGEQLTSTDPYNTTVFVGGLSPLISEDTLRTFFAPFGDIHYVKVPVGKHCGFVQFVRKADAERAIEKMQGFPIGGSRIRLSWGRSQYKAAQAAAQAAQAAALQAQLQSQPSSRPQPLTAEQVIELLHQYGLTDLLPNNSIPGGNDTPGMQSVNPNQLRQMNEENLRSLLLNRDNESGLPPSFDIFPKQSFMVNANVNSGGQNDGRPSSFSPFSPDANSFSEENRNRESGTQLKSDLLPHHFRGFAPGFGPVSTQNQDANAANGNGSRKTPPITPTSSQAGRPPQRPPAFWVLPRTLRLAFWSCQTPCQRRDFSPALFDSAADVSPPPRAD